MKPSSCKAKGRSFQQKVATWLLAKFPTLQPDDIRSCSMGSGGEDLQLSPAARLLIPHQIECKKHKSFAVYGLYDQARKHGKHEPLLIIEADRREPLAVVNLAYYLNLLGGPTRE
jgi:hypothetical protein